MNNFDFKIRNVQRDEGGNWIILDIAMLSIDLTICCLYGPNDDQPNFYNNMKDKTSHLRHSDLTQFPPIPGWSSR